MIKSISHLAKPTARAQCTYTYEQSVHTHSVNEHSVHVGVHIQRDAATWQTEAIRGTCAGEGGRGRGCALLTECG